MTKNDQRPAGARAGRRPSRPPQPRVTVTELDEHVPHALYQHFELEATAQACHVALDVRTGELSAGYNPMIGESQPVDVGRRLLRWWPIPCLTAADANALMRAIVPLAERVFDDTTVQSNGRTRVGVLGSDAEAAERDVHQLIADHTIDAQVWFKKRKLPAGFSSTTTDDDLDAIIAEQQRDVLASHPDRHVWLGNARAWLVARREAMRQAERAELQAVAETLKNSKNRRDTLIANLNAFAQKNDIAASAGITPQGVDRVIKGATRDRSTTARSLNEDHAELRAAAAAMATAEERRDQLVIRLRTYTSAYAIAPLAGMTRQGVAYVVQHKIKPAKSGRGKAPSRRTSTRAKKSKG